MRDEGNSHRNGGGKQLELSDYELVKRCLSGNQDAFSELVTRYKRLVYSVVYNMVSNRQEADDIAQEVFLRIYKALDRYNPEYRFSTWTVKITTNFCRDLYRKKKVESVSMEEVAGLSSSSDTPEEVYVTKERTAKIREAVDSLPEKYRILVVLFHQNGLSYEEMANALDEPMTIIKNRLYRARLMLRDKLEGSRKEEVL